MKTSICGLCGKEFKNIFRYKMFDMDFCMGCYGYVNQFCKSPEDVKRRTKDELNALNKKNICDLCGEKVPTIHRKYVYDGMICNKCVHILRAYYNNNAEKCAAFISNALILALSITLDAALDGCGADDPMERASIEELRKIYEMVLTEKSSS